MHVGDTVTCQPIANKLTRRQQDSCIGGVSLLSRRAEYSFILHSGLDGLPAYATNMYNNASATCIEIRVHLTLRRLMIDTVHSDVWSW